MFARKAMLAGIQSLLMLGACVFSAWAGEYYEAYYLYLGNDPGPLQSDWSNEAQGLTHDDDHWYITQNDPQRLWKIPVTHNLNYVSCGGSVVCRTLNDWPALHDEGYNHLGDPSYYEGFVIVPVEGGPVPAIAVFRADNLQYVVHAYLTEQRAAGWSAVDPQGNVYSSNSRDVIAIKKYAVDWDTLQSSDTPLILTTDAEIILFDEDGSLVTPLQIMQGGVISPSGKLLYIVAGYYDELRPTDGIHVFDLSTGRRVQRSTNGYGHFNYEFHPGCCDFQEPEGITIWDLENTPSPHHGQLHVMLLDNRRDGIYIKHYTGTILVDATNTGAQDGTPERPFRTITAAANLAWNGAEIRIRADVYPENITFLKAVRLRAESGTVRIGD